MALKELETVEPISNGAQEIIQYTEPYQVTVVIEGTAPILFHAWNNEAVEEQANAAKGSRAKKTDNVESFVYRLPAKGRTKKGEIAIPGEYLRMAVINAAKYRQDPRSPRKSAMDLYKAGIVSLTEYATLGKTTWDYLDKRRVVIQRNAVTRSRPAFLAGWTATFDLQVQLPEYIPTQDLHQVLINAGRLIGLGDFRPSYGRFVVNSFSVAS